MSEGKKKNFIFFLIYLQIFQGGSIPAGNGYHSPPMINWEDNKTTRDSPNYSPDQTTALIRSGSSSPQEFQPISIIQTDRQHIQNLKRRPGESLQQIADHGRKMVKKDGKFISQMKDYVVIL